MNKILVSTIHGLMSTSLLATSAVHAQQAASQRAAAIEEIVVTATKREQSLQDVSISLVAYTGDSLREFAIHDIASLYVQTPSMAYSQAGGEAQIYIRGIGTNIFGVGADASVGVHQDGVYLGRTQMALNQFLDVERVEVLRGPQGTLYGRNTTGGAINIISRQPGDEWAGYVSGAVGSWNRREIVAAAGGPVSDIAGIRLAGRYMKDDGYTRNINPGSGVDVDDNDIRQLRAILNFEPSDALRFSLIADWSDFENGNTSVRPRDNLGAAQAQGALPPPPFGQIRNDLDSFHEWDTWGITGTLSYQLSPTLELTSITAYRDYESDFLFNTDGTEVDVTRSNFEYASDQLSQELRLAYAGDGPLSVIGGLYYLREDKEGGLGLIRASGRPLFGSVPGSTGSFIIPSTNETTAWAAFTEATWALNDRVDVILGARYSREKKDDTSSVGAVFDLNGLRSTATPIVFSTREDSRSWSEFTPKIGIDFRASEDILLYASYSEGFKSGGFNSLDANPAFDQESVKAFEVGAKSDWLDNRLRLNAAAFYYDYEDLQVSTFINNLTLTTNAAAATIWGIEADIVARPVPALDITAGISFLDAEYDEFTDRQGNNPDGTPRVLDLSGNTPPNAPEFKGTVQMQYTLDLAGGHAVVMSGRYSYQSRVYFTQFNEDIVGQKGFGLLDARLAWLSADGRWEVAAHGRNLSDEEYFLNGVRFTSTSDALLDPRGIGNSLGYPAAGRSWGLTLTHSF